VPCAPPSNITEAERNALATTSLLEGGRSFHCRVSSVDGISMGMIQWNLAAGTLQQKLALFDQRTRGGLQKYFGADTQLVRDLVRMRGSRELNRQAVAKARSENLHGRWKSILEQLCADPDFCTIQQEDIRNRLCSAWEGVSVVGLASVRGLCMMFDINTGDGLSRAKMRLLRQGLDAEQTRLDRALAEADKLSLLADLAANRLTQYREERRARRKNLAGIPTLYRGDRRWAERINSAVPNLDRALTAADRSVC